MVISIVVVLCSVSLLLLHLQLFGFVNKARPLGLLASLCKLHTNPDFRHIDAKFFSPPSLWQSSVHQQYQYRLHVM